MTTDGRRAGQPEVASRMFYPREIDNSLRRPWRWRDEDGSDVWELCAWFGNPHPLACYRSENSRTPDRLQGSRFEVRGSRFTVRGTTRYWVHRALVGPGPIFSDVGSMDPSYSNKGEYLEAQGWKWYYFDAQR
jgi:hypothetical protein